MIKNITAKVKTETNVLKNHIKLAGFSLILSIVAIVLSSYINTLAFDIRPMVGDKAYQFMTSADTYLNFLYNGRWATIWNAFTSYARPIWAILPLIVNPDLLIDINGHILIGGIFLFCFLTTLGVAVLKRTQSLFYAFACMGGVLTAEKFIHFSLGMGGNYTDLQTAWMIGAALFALINSEEGQQGKWLMVFSFFAALAQQSRFVSLGVTAVVCGPILGLYLLRRWQATRSSKALWIFVAQAAIPLIVISGYSLIKFVDHYIQTYFFGPMVTSGIIHMFKPVKVALALFFSAYDDHLGSVGLVVLFIFLIAYFRLYWRARAKDFSLFVSLWAAVAFPLLHIFVLRIADEWIYTVYMLPGLYLIAFIPFNLLPEKLPLAGPKPEIRKALYFGLLIIVIFVNINNFYKLSDSVDSGSDLDRQVFEYQRDLSLILNQLIGKYYLNPATLEEVPSFESFVEISALTSAQPIYIDVWYRHRVMVRWVYLSKVWKSMYQESYSNLPLEQIQELTYQKALESVDFVIVLSDPRNEKAVSLSHQFSQFESDEWNLKINEYMYNRLSENQIDWSDEFISDDGVYNSPFGDIHVYRNLKRYARRISK